MKRGSAPGPRRSAYRGKEETAPVAPPGPGTIPLGFGDGDPFSFRAGRPWTAGEFRRDAGRIALRHTHAVNLCRDRHAFLAGLVAAVSGGRTTLLPSSAAAAEGTVSTYAPCDLLDDEHPAGAGPASRAAPIAPQEDFVALIGHTSGSTGVPVAHRKAWSALQATTALNAAAVRGLLPAAAARPWIVATVPCQHMYGMETAALLPLLAGFAIHAGHPLFPADIAQALSEVPAPRVLVTTPVHLRALLRAGIDLPPVDVMVSATAPLSRELARDVETRFGTGLLEMFGATETCVFATRRTAVEEAWQPYRGVRLEPETDFTRVSAPWLEGAIPLQDVLEVRRDGRFVVVGRNADLVDVAGKRASLADLTARIAALRGVEDVLVLQPEEPDSMGVRRVAALVVAPGAEPAALLDALRASLDPAFLPRPLLIVDSLPRNAVGKIPRSEALRLLKERVPKPGQPGAD